MRWVDKLKPHVGSLAATLCGWALLAGLVLGSALLILSAYAGWTQYQAQAWPARPAVVEVARAVWDRRPGKSHFIWLPEICVRYLDDGMKDCIRRIRFGSTVLSDGGGWAFGAQEPRRPPGERVKDVIARYPVGREVRVHHEPGKRQNRVLEVSPSWRPLQMKLFMGVGLLAFSGGGMAVAARLRGKGLTAGR